MIKNRNQLQPKADMDLDQRKINSSGKKSIERQKAEEKKQMDEFLSQERGFILTKDIEEEKAYKFLKDSEKKGASTKKVNTNLISEKLGKELSYRGSTNRQVYP